MNGGFLRRAFAVTGVVVATVPVIGQAPGNTRCQSDIVSATVVATSCIHVEGETQVVDLLILWRGRPGWFQPSAGPGSGAGGGNGGSSAATRATRGQVSRWVTYGDVTIAFDADFDARTVTIDESPVRLDSINVVLVDSVDVPSRRTIARTARVDPALPLAAETNLALTQRSSDVRDYLQCQIAMPPPAARTASPPPRVITVCEKLQRLR